MTATHEIVEILMVEDNPAEVRMVKELLKGSALPTRINVVTDGDQAMSYLNRERNFKDSPRPHIVLLDLRLPKKNGHEVLRDMKKSAVLKDIPVIIFSSSRESEDVTTSYRLNANCYVSKPRTLEEYESVFSKLKEFWFGGVVRFPLEAA